ncbi:MAG: ATP cone domain-containing protein [Methanomassiliicoccus sp.]|nr:ATP cone domain-containing protein [Methanomassiliicoccus sp.]
MRIIEVIKRSGEREEFDPRKTISAIVRSGVAQDEAQKIVRDLEPLLYDGITTEEIYRQVRQMIKGPSAAHYSLKKALFRLGPDGENFESYIARLFQAEGYSTKTRQILNGKCVKHEVDVLMAREQEKVMVECKFHNDLGLKCNIQIALYVYARFLDLRDTEKIDRPILVTNTRLSLDAQHYAECVGMDVLGWKTPRVNGLESLVNKHRLFPLTMLEMHHRDQATLLENHFILVKDVLSRSNEVKLLLSKESADDVISQAMTLMST